MKIEKLLTLLMALAPISFLGQGNSIEDNLYKDGLAYLGGITKTYNPQLAKSLFYEASEKGYAPAMNELGNIYSNGITNKRNVDSAIYWYKKSVDAGDGNACYNIGNLYKMGTGVPQNFKEAFKYYLKGLEMNNGECKKAVAYMYYKGLGATQDYAKAFKLFKETAEAGNKNAMYFLALCYRNGYGTNVNAQLATLWLQKAAARYERQAISELKENTPENISAVSPQIQYEINDIKEDIENFKAANSNNYGGVYKGYAIYYDWSGKFVSEIQPLTLELKKQNSFYTGFWKEGNSEAAEIKMSSNNNNFKFKSGCSYTRNNHYSGRKPETWHFNEADLDLAFKNDSIVLSGFVQFYSKERREPGKPLQIILKRSIGEIEKNNTTAVKLSLYPNPANNYANVQFTLLKPSKIVFQIYAQNGALVYADAEKVLPTGTYNYNLPIDKLMAGAYNVQLLVNGKIGIAKTFVKQ